MTKVKVATGIVLISILGSFAFGQTSKGTIAGTVSDSTGAVIRGATVTAKDTLGAEVRTQTTGDAGQFRMDNVLPSIYEITIAAPDFATYKLEKLNVDASVVTAVNAVLQPGPTRETITVEASAAGVSTESAELGRNITQREVHDLPLSSLNSVELAVTEPGVLPINVIRDSNTNGQAYSVNGLRPRENNFLIDGFDNNDKAIAGQALQSDNPEAIGETVVLTNSYNAEFGGGGASVTNQIYKRGTNNWHGSAFERYSQADWNALQPFQKNQQRLTRVPQFVRNVYGFAVGGPLVKNKIFVFGASQWDHFIGAELGTPMVIPDATGIATLQSILPGLPTQSQSNVNLLVSSLAGTSVPVASGVVNIGPRTGCNNVDGSGNCLIETGNYQRAARDHNPSQEYDVRVDFLPNSNNALFVRYINSTSSLTPDLFANPGALPTADTQQGGPARNVGVYWNHIFSPTLLNELRVSAQQINFGFNLTPATLASPLANQPAISIAGLFSNSPLVTFGGPTTGFPQGRGHNTYQYQDAVSWTKGKHSFKLGFDIAHLSISDAIPFNDRGTLTINRDAAHTGLANYIDDFTGPAGIVAISFGNPNVSYPQTAQAYYFQDAWKLLPNLTVTYGLRYDYQGTPANAAHFPAIPDNPSTGAFVFTPAPGIFKPVRITQQPDRSDFGPRLGIAYSPRFAKWLFGENKTAIRAGAGIYYDPFFSNILDNIVGGPPDTQGGTINAGGGRGAPNAVESVLTLTPTADPFGQSDPVSSTLRTPMVYQWNINIQRELPWNTLFEVGYVGTRGTYLFGNMEMNPGINRTAACVLSASGCSPLNPDRGRIVLRSNHDDSIYHSLQLNVTHRFAKGLYLQGAYTFSKALDNGSEIFTTSGGTTRWATPFLPSSDRGPSAFDRKHRAVITYVWDLPSPKSNEGFMKAFKHVAGGWQLSGTYSFQTGAPETIYSGGFDINGDLNAFNDRPSISNLSVPLNYSQCFGQFTAFNCNTGIGWSLDGVNYSDFNSGFDTDPVTGAQIGSAKDFRYVFVVGQPGSLRRNSVYNPGRQDWNASVSKHIKMPVGKLEGQELLLRLELFNPFNHHNLGGGTEVPGIVGDANNPNFLNTAITQESERNIRIYVRWSF